MSFPAVHVTHPVSVASLEKELALCHTGPSAMACTVRGAKMETFESKDSNRLC